MQRHKLAFMLISSLPPLSPSPSPQPFPQPLQPALPHSPSPQLLNRAPPPSSYPQPFPQPLPLPDNFFLVEFLLFIAVIIGWLCCRTP